MTESTSSAKATLRFATVRLAGAGANADPELELDFSETLRSSLVPGQAVVRHRKTWRLGQVTPLPGRPDVVLTRVGFEDSRTTTSWSPEAGDFVSVDVPDGSASTVVLDVTTGTLAYQAQEPSGVLSAFQALLNAAGQGRWVVQRVLRDESWESWRRRVTRVTKLRIRLRRPNPNFVGRERVQQVMEGSRAAVIELALSAPVETLEGLDLEEELVKQSLAHAEMGYGSFKADGHELIDGVEVQRRYDSQAEGAELVEELDTEAAGQVSASRMSEALSTVGPDALTEVTDEDEDADI